MAEREIFKVKAVSSVANLGVGYDCLVVGLDKPYIEGTFITNPNSNRMYVRADTDSIFPKGKKGGHAARKALKTLVEEYPGQKGFLLLRDGPPDKIYQMGGNGRSGTEAVIAVMTYLVAIKRNLPIHEILRLCAQGEPGNHMDNVAGSLLGNIVILSPDPMNNFQIVPKVVKPPENLSIAIGVSNHPKSGGTEGARLVMENPWETSEVTQQVALGMGFVSALYEGNVPELLRFALGDQSHEKRRADIGAYGGFKYPEFFEFKKWLFQNFGVALLVSGAGPNMAMLYDRSMHREESRYFKPTVEDWFSRFGITMRIENRRIAEGGAYQDAVKRYGYGA